MSKIPVYFMPGLAASALIEQIALQRYIWNLFIRIPLDNESLTHM
jgi:hypothetical protein